MLNQGNEESHEEILIMSTAFWVREICVMKLKFLQDDKTLAL